MHLADANCCLKLLSDQNLSRKLVNRLADVFPDSSYVRFHDLAAEEYECD
ncbi:DUF5615 family PIN-like protein [cf. Phormidesmis sp. LEGE 11477]